MLPSKPVIAAISGYAVAGGLELALWCDLRIMEEDAILGVFSRRFGVPLIDGGTQRLPRIIGLGRALDLILTGRPVRAEEAYAMGLVNRVVGHGHALDTAIDLANQLKSFPQAGLRSDRAAVYAGIETSLEDGMIQEFSRGMQVLREGESQEGAQQFVNGIGRHGKF
jgi:enoyl-CoA hydratase